MVTFPMTLSDHNLDFSHGVIINALDVLCAQLTSILFAIAKCIVFLSRASTLTRDIDIAILSICLSVRPFPYSMETA